MVVDDDFGGNLKGVVMMADFMAKIWEMVVEGDHFFAYEFCPHTTLLGEYQVCLRGHFGD